MLKKYLYNDPNFLCVQHNMLQCLWCSKSAKYCGGSWPHIPSYILRKGDENFQIIPKYIQFIVAVVQWMYFPVLQARTTLIISPAGSLQEHALTHTHTHTNTHRGDILKRMGRQAPVRKAKRSVMMVSRNGSVSYTNYFSLVSENIYIVTSQWSSSGMAIFHPWEGRIIHKDLPEGHSCIYMYRTERLVCCVLPQ